MTKIFEVKSDPKEGYVLSVISLNLVIEKVTRKMMNREGGRELEDNKI